MYKRLVKWMVEFYYGVYSKKKVKEISCTCENVKPKMDVCVSIFISSESKEMKNLSVKI